jgi:hypothetical protein
VALTNIRVTPVLLDAAGRVAQQGSPVRISRALPPRERIAVDAGVGQVTQQQLQYIRFKIDNAQPAE